MVQALFFKEWLKIRKLLLASIILFILILTKIALTMSYDARINDANAYWYTVFIRQSIFYAWLKYIPALVGIIIAVSQFVPEISASRLKLSLHLPMKENKIILMMLGVGTISITVIYFISLIIFGIILNQALPSEILFSAIITSTPWFLNGLILYWAVSTIFLEPRWNVRILFILITVSILSSLYLTYSINSFEKSIFYFAILGLVFFLSTLLTSYRYRGGVL